MVGLQKAINQTLEIAKYLPNKDDKKLYKKTVQSIFDDQLQIYTDFNRKQRREALKQLKEAMKNYD